MIEQNYTGYLLAVHPRRRDPLLTKGVMLIIEHDETGAVGLQINKPFVNDLSFETVMNNVGLHAPEDHPLYNGGPTHSNRINVIHSLDWYSNHTVKLSEKIGVSYDLSILTAIAANEGPAQFRVVAGCVHFGPGQLDNEMGKLPQIDVSWSWNAVKAKPERIFDSDGIDQWHQITTDAGKQQISKWFSPVRD
jgi:putative transcriptional regulator